MKTPIRALLFTALLLATLPAVMQAQDYTFTTNGGAITITGYTGPGGAVSIPDTINGLPVTSIGDYAFYNKSSLTSVTIPNSVTSIGSLAFYSCTSLTSVTIPNSVTSIGNYAFYSCTSLTNVTIGNGVTSIGDQVFNYCASLSAITVDALNSVYSSVDGVLFNKSQTLLIQCPGGKAGSYTIPNSVTSIGSVAFSYCTSLTSVTIPSSVTSIGSVAFSYCTSLTSVTIPSSVTGIGNYAFQYCTSLTSVTIGNGVTGIGIYAFYSCTSLTSVTIGNSVTAIGNHAFQYCTSLTSVTIPNSVYGIGDYAFESCTSLTSVTIGNSVYIIGNFAFSSCSNRTGIYFQGSAPEFVGSSVFGYPNNVTVYYLPGTTGWLATFGGRPTALWLPQVQAGGASFGVQTNQFGFNILWASGQIIVVEACTNVANPAWIPLQTNTLTGSSSYFSDPQWTDHPARFYRLRSP